MKKNSIYANSKIRKNSYKYAIEGIQQFNQSLVSSDIKRNNKDKSLCRFDKNLFDKGMEWFNNGLPLEDAADELKNNSCFKNGFVKAKRLELIRTTLYNYGIEYYNKGIILDEVPLKYRNNDDFVRGYEFAKKNGKMLVLK